MAHVSGLVLSAHFEARKAELLIDALKAVEAPIHEPLFKCSAAAAGIVAYIQEIIWRGLWPSPTALQCMCVAHFIANMLTDSLLKNRHDASASQGCARTATVAAATILARAPAAAASTATAASC